MFFIGTDPYQTITTNLQIIDRFVLLNNTSSSCQDHEPGFLALYAERFLGTDLQLAVFTLTMPRSVWG